MRLCSFILAATLVLGFSVQADAATVTDYSGTGVNVGMTNLVDGDSGSWVVSSSTGLLSSIISGYLPSNSMLTFSYDLGVGSAIGGISHVSEEYGSSSAWGNLMLSAAGSVSGVSSLSDLLVSTSLNVSTNIVTTTITNLSAVAAKFTSLVSAVVMGTTDMTVGYSVSSVPLPAALPLFALGLAGLAGVGLRRRKDEVTE